MQMLLVEEIVAFCQSERTSPPLTRSYGSRLGPQGLGVRTEETNRLLFSFQAKCCQRGVLLCSLAWERKCFSITACVSCSCCFLGFLCKNFKNRWATSLCCLLVWAGMWGQQQSKMLVFNTSERGLQGISCLQWKTVAHSLVVQPSLTWKAIRTSSQN